MLHNLGLFTNHYNGTNSFVLSCELQKGHTGLWAENAVGNEEQKESKQICFLFQ